MCPRPLARRLLIRSFAITVCTLALLAAPAAQASYHREDARKAAATVGWTGQEWAALDAIIQPESGWDSCSSYPSRHDCGYSGSNSCGIPQANPCPSAWRGRLDSTWRQQIAWMLRYIAVRYRTPSGALSFRRAHGYY